jgi:glycosyltransferase involved in cell wall biosynthesis
LRAARTLVFPSVWYEGQPLTVLEAKAMGTPVIVSDACAGREEVADKLTGLWFRSNDIDDLARALREAQDGSRIAAMSAAAHQAYWADPPTPEKHVARLLGLYRQMLARAGRPVSERDAPVAAEA